MNPVEDKLVDNSLFFLDRLFDRKLTTLEVWALLYATCQAFRGTEHQVHYEEAASDLAKITRLNESESEKQDRALVSTDGFRKYLAMLTRR